MKQKQTEKYYIQANEGFFLINPISGENGVDGLHRVPIIGWKLDDDGTCTPITCEGLEHDENYVIEQPLKNWKFCAPWQQDFRTEEEVIQYFQDYYKRTMAPKNGKIFRCTKTKGA